MKRPIAVNMSNYPIVAYVYEIDDKGEKIKAVICSAVQDVKEFKPRWYDLHYNKAGDPYFHTKFKFYLHECVKTTS